jgi:hypothetical protein
MAIDPTTTTTVKVGELASAGFNTTDLIPHEVAGILKKGNLQDLATFIGSIISTDGAVGFRAVNVNDGETLPATTEQEFILVGPGTYPNVGGGATITTTEPLNALVSNGTYWFIGVEIPITATGVWGTITGVLSDQTDLNDVLESKADLIDGKVPNSQLPSYIDDVVEVANYAALPASGETGKIYVTIDNGNVYRWSGSAYIRIADSSAVWGTITGTLSNQTDLQNALNGKFNNPTGDTTQYIAGNGTLVSFPIAGQAGTIVREVRNTTGSTLTKGTIVYISGASGNKPTVTKAIATGDSTSAQTFGMVQASISNNSNGYVVCMGDLTGLDTSALTEGAQLYLSSTTAGAYTTTKQTAPAHLVYIGVVTRSHATQGQIEVKIQNGYELDEIHDVAISSVANNEVLVYESATGLWKNKTIPTILGYTPQAQLSGTGFIKASGTTISYDNTTYVPTSRTITINGFGYDLSSNVNFTINPGVWGQITGALSNQTDLQQTLNTKEGTISGGTTSQYWRGDKSWQNLNKTAVGLANVDNTTDLGKPISTATQTALDLKVPTSRSITINGVGYNLSADVNFNIGAGVWGQITGTLSNQTDLYQTLNTKVPADRTITINGVTQSLTTDRSWTISAGIGGTGTNGYVAFWNGTSNQAGDSNLFWDNTNKRLGIGTTSPSTICHLYKASYPVLTIQSSSYQSSLGIDTSSGTLVLNNESNGALAFNTNATERMRITSGGNVGIGVIPQFTIGGYVSMEIGTAGLLYSTTNTNNSTVTLASNVYYNGGWKYKNNSGASLFGQNDGSFTFETAPTGTSGSSATITERMRITSGGRVGIGFTSPVAKLSVRGEDNTSSNYAFEAANGSGASLFYVRNDGATVAVGTITSSGGFFNSDIRLKDIISRDEDVIEFTWKDGRDNKKHIGVIAQEVQKLYPDMVQEGTDEEKTLSVNYIELLVLKNRQLEKRIESLEKLISNSK